MNQGKLKAATKSRKKSESLFLTIKEQKPIFRKKHPPKSKSRIVSFPQRRSKKQSSAKRTHKNRKHTALTSVAQFKLKTKNALETEKIKNIRKYFKSGLTITHNSAIIIWRLGNQGLKFAGMAELADARDLKSREIFSRTGSTPASGTNISRSGAVW